MFEKKSIDACRFKLQVHFYSSDNGIEPVRDWLKSLSLDSRKTIGEDIKTVQFGWPLGMPVVRKLDRDLWEVRVQEYVMVLPG